MTRYHSLLASGRFRELDELRELIMLQAHRLAVACGPAHRADNLPEPDR
ncbi:MAG TPA: hypothetical protein VGN37_28950 [Actinocatenispora sp.]